MRIHAGNSSLTLTEMNGCVYVADLEGNDLKGSLRLAQIVKGIQAPTFLMIHEDNPRKEALMKAYKRYVNAKPAFFFMEVVK